MFFVILPERCTLPLVISICHCPLPGSASCACCFITPPLCTHTTAV